LDSGVKDEVFKRERESGSVRERGRRSERMCAMVGEKEKEG
jgi:hypothetical protein